MNRPGLHTVAEVAEHYKVSTERVLLWIHRSELAAVDINKGASGRKPVYRISEKALDEFDRNHAAAA
jgi:hypothetical protein